MIDPIRLKLTRMHTTAPFRCLCLTAALMVSVFTNGPAVAVEMGDYKVPSLDGYTVTREESGDGDGDGLKETHIVHYHNEAGDRIFSMTTKGKLWAWSQQSQASVESDHNYVIRDNNCDGIFEQRYSLDEDFHVPDCLQYQRKSKPADHP